MSTLMSTRRNPLWSRRDWLASQSQALGLATVLLQTPRAGWRSPTAWRGHPARAAAHPAQAERLDFTPWRALAQQGVDAARAAGARYADARLTRVVRHDYGVDVNDFGVPVFTGDDEIVGVGVRALVDGYWGFSASAVLAPDEVVRLAHDAVGQAKENAKGPPWTVDFGTVPVATGNWTTPIRIDPFTIPVEDKQDFILY
jgi:hypothetical protein